MDGTPKGSPVFDTPIDVRYDACEKAFYVLQTGFGSPSEPGRVMKVDATTGTRSLFATYQGAENYALLLRPSGAPEDQPVSPLHVRDMRGVRVDAIETRNRSS